MYLPRMIHEAAAVRRRVNAVLPPASDAVRDAERVHVQRFIQRGVEVDDAGHVHDRRDLPAQRRHSVLAPGPPAARTSTATAAPPGASYAGGVLRMTSALA